MLYSLLKALFDLASLLSTSLSNLPSDVLVYGLQHSLANGDASKVILFTRCWLVEDFCLFQADLESEELGSFCMSGVTRLLRYVQRGQPRRQREGLEIAAHESLCGPAVS